MERARQPNRLAMIGHLQWLVEPLDEQNTHLRIEIAWGDPERGPNPAKTFRLDQIDAAEASTGGPYRAHAEAAWATLNGEFRKDWERRKRLPMVDVTRTFPNRKSKVVVGSYA
jgi:hypothetical protein